jgi:hypothetical protein
LEADGGWLDQLLNRIEFVIGSISGLFHYLNNNSGLDVLIVTARKWNEYAPFFRVLIGWPVAQCPSQS